jgi:hypothetical protein
MAPPAALSTEKLTDAEVVGIVVNTVVDERKV